MDVAIVGGGVAGCYCAYRLARANPDWRIALFEAEERVGGRLRSVPTRGQGAAPAEMGGMFIGSKQRHVVQLAGHLQLALRKVRWSQGTHYLRGRYIDSDGYAAGAEVLPYRLAQAERGKHPIDVLHHALRQVAPQLDHLWPANSEGPPRATYDALRSIRHNGLPLWDWGFWNLISDVVSHEAHSLLMSTIGFGSILRNANALESIWTLLRNMDPGQDFFAMENGYQQLPLALYEGAKRNVELHAGTRLVAVERDRASFVLKLEHGSIETIAHAQRLILALPRRGLELIDLDDALFLDAAEFRRTLRAVAPSPACKLYLAFDDPWWERSKRGPGRLDVGAVAVAFTDLPMRQCFYFAKPTGTGARAPLMSAYTDDVTHGFWSSLARGEGALAESAAMHNEDVSALICPQRLVDSALKQLAELHDDVSVPAPAGALFKDWGADPHGGGWHDWAPNVRSWRVGPQMRQANPNLDLFVCGEAYSQRQGWVEGAINSAEMVMRQLGLGPPEWLCDPSYEFEIESEPRAPQTDPR